MMRMTGIIVGILLCAGMAAAHAPMKVDLAFEKETGFLSVTFQHKVRNAKDHFVYLVKVRLNKQEVIEQNLNLQDDENGGSLIYKLNDVKSGDTVEVRLECVKGGSKTGKIKIE
jgi:hypothetical protein